MGEDTKIEWAQHTFNPWIGCEKESPGCDHCYAEQGAAKRLQVSWGPDAERRMTSASNWQKPIRWNKNAAQEGNSPIVFCSSLADVFEGRAELDLPRRRLWKLIEDTPHLTWALLTKRAYNIMSMVPERWHEDWPYHVLPGVSVESQRYADERIPLLLRVPAPRRFVSLEPLLGPVDLCHIQYDNLIEIDALNGTHGVIRPHRGKDGPKLDWVIAGGETKKGARPMHPAWIDKFVRQCRSADVPFFFKQWGEWHPLGRPPYKDSECVVFRCGYWGSNTYQTCEEHAKKHEWGRCSHSGMVMRRVGKRHAGRKLELTESVNWDEELYSGRIR